jgi:hypothetical protein
MQSLLHLRIIEVSVYVMDAARVISWYLHSLVEKKIFQKVNIQGNCNSL